VECSSGPSDVVPNEHSIEHQFQCAEMWEVSSTEKPFTISDSLTFDSYKSLICYHETYSGYDNNPIGWVLQVPPFREQM
jgi:hypothetical protein